MKNEFFVGLSTTDSENEATEIARALVHEKLAACVNILPNLRSIYRWQDKICDEKEFLLIIKTSAKNLDKIKERIKTIHHYEVPELIFLPIKDGLPDYLSWIEKMVLS